MNPTKPKKPKTSKPSKPSKPITSYGVITKRNNPNTGETEYLLVRRKDTVSYVVFLRGLYSREMLPVLASRMTQAERKRIRNSTFDALWEGLWEHHPSKQFHHRNKFIKQKERAESKFQRKDWDIIFDMVKSKYTEPEWGFPKGRKKNNETAMQGALREFEEETGLTRDLINITLNGLSPCIEFYKATDSKEYQIVYFLADLLDYNTPLPSINENFRDSEISDIGWFTVKQCMLKIREYHIEKKELLRKIA